MFQFNDLFLVQCIKHKLLLDTIIAVFQVNTVIKLSERYNIHRAEGEWLNHRIDRKKHQY